MTQLNLNTLQHRLILCLLLKPERTDVLASAIGVKNHEVSNALLPLRSLGLVSTFNDGGPYVQWSATAQLREELRHNGAPPPPSPVIAPVYILWCPTSNYPSKVTYNSLQQAQEVQEIMARKHPGKVFHICEVGIGIKAEHSVKLVEV